MNTICDQVQCLLSSPNIGQKICNNLNNRVKTNALMSHRKFVTMLILLFIDLVKHAVRSIRTWSRTCLLCMFVDKHSRMLMIGHYFFYNKLSVRTSFYTL